jgi:hypothetical protein
MNSSKLRLIPSKIIHWLLPFLAIYSIGCVYQRSLSPDVEFLPQPDYAQLVADYRQCRGKGTILSQGGVKGQLTFSFTSNGDSTFLLFKDLLGRKTAFLGLFQNELVAWDILQNRVYNRSALQELYPWVMWLEPAEFTSMLWGITPKTLTNKEGEYNFERSSGRISLVTKPESQGNLIQQIMFENPAKKVNITLQIASREFGATYPQLRQIGSRILTEVIP